MDYRELVAAKAEEYGIPTDLAMRWVMTESGFNESAVSNRGAAGLIQIMPDTAQNPGYGVTPITPDERFDPETNLDFGMQYLRAMKDKYGSWDLALAAYNAGPGAVNKAGGVPEFEETQGYLRKILGDQPIAQGGNEPRPGDDVVTGEGIYTLMDELQKDDDSRKMDAAMRILEGTMKTRPRARPEVPSAAPMRSLRPQARPDPLRRFEGLGSLRDAL
jgi:hypothetical protein